MVSGVCRVDGGDSQRHSKSMSGLCSSGFFSTIPPERMGLNGEYDHEGLSKRVCHAFSQYFNAEELRSLKVKQRGSVVILAGSVPTYALLARLIHIALSTDGTVDVEANGVLVQESLERRGKPVEFLGTQYSYGWVS